MHVSKIGSLLKKIRLAHKKETEEIATYLNMSKCNYQKIERDEIDISRINLVKLSHLYGIAVQDLCNDSPQINSQETNTQNFVTQALGGFSVGVDKELKFVYNKLVCTMEQLVAEQKNEIEIFKAEKQKLQFENLTLRKKLKDLKSRD
jgi:transcriptional regulator with XRE-family HTH domain